MEREKQLSILYQKQGRATQFSSKAARDRWLQKEIDDLQRILSSNTVQVDSCILRLLCLQWCAKLSQTSYVRNESQAISCHIVTYND